MAKYSSVGKNKGLFGQIPKLLSHCSLRRRFQLCLLMILMLVSGVTELVSLGSILPFLTLLSEPERLWQLPLVHYFSAQVGIQSSRELMLPAAICFAVVAIISAVIRLCNLWLSARLSAAIGCDLSCESYMRTLYQPYSVHMQRNSSTVIAATTNHIRATVIVFTSLLQVVSSIVIFLGIFAGLILIDGIVALTATMLFGGIYILLSSLTRTKLSHNSRNIVLAAQRQVQSLQEGLGSIRDVLLDGNQQMYVEAYRQSDWPQRLLGSRNLFLSTFPRYVLEALALVAIAIFGSLIAYRGDSGIAVIPLLGVLALGAQRLLPAAQQIYNGWATIKSASSDIDAVLDMLAQPMPQLSASPKPYQLMETIRFNGVDFKYKEDSSPVLKGLSFEINQGERIGFIGATGSGKTTAVDILMGLLIPTGGSILIDGKNLHDPIDPELIASWRAAIAHVPQNIYLSDNSVAENIAFGIAPDKIDMRRVKESAEKAQIAEYIESTPDGYNAFVGERGVRLSGGQRQRIGIARALYKQSSILVFDEATSALDTQTERAVMQSIEKLSNELTIITIAHRLSTIAHCDRVFLLDHGSIVQQGPPDVLIGNFKHDP